MASVELDAAVNAKNLKIRFNTANEVTSFLTRLMGCIQRSRSALVNPKKRTLDELRSNKHAVSQNNNPYILLKDHSLICIHNIHNITLRSNAHFLLLQRGLVPAIPAELALSFYLQGWKLIFAVYHIVVDPKTHTSKFNRYQAEAVIPWVNDVILYLTIALQTAQQLKDKVICILSCITCKNIMILKARRL